MKSDSSYIEDSTLKISFLAESPALFWAGSVYEF